MNKHFKAQTLADGYTRIVDRANSDLTQIEMGRLRLSRAGDSFRGSTEDREVGFNLLAGVIRLQVHTRDSGDHAFAPVGRRPNPFAGPPAMVYLPIRSEYTLEVLQGPFEAAVYSVPATQAYAPRVVGPEEIATVRTGELNWTRHVRQGIAENVRAQRLIMGETLAPSGNWSSYPPHKHDEQRPPFEQPAEEVYSFHFDRPQGFGFIRLYTPAGAPDAFDEAYTVCDGDVITVARGYHPVTVAPGYRCCYLFCLAGAERLYGAWSDDPEHAWLRGCETVVRGNDLG